MGTTPEAELEKLFTSLRKGSYRTTSPRSSRYNCIAWALGHDDIRFDYHPLVSYYWPRRCPRDDSVDAFVCVLCTEGFEQCESGDLRPDTEKVAIYAKGQVATHVARQLPTGLWTSKIGVLEDIEHELADLEGEEYGRIACFLSRPIKRGV